MNRVKLESAFAWECTTCHHLNFETADRGELRPDHAEMIGFCWGDVVDACHEAVPDFTDDGMNMAEVLVSRIAIAPHLVTCRKCGEKFLSEIRYDELREFGDDDSGE